MFPVAAAGEEFLARARELADAPDLPAFARARLLIGTDALARQLPGPRRLATSSSRRSSSARRRPDSSIGNRSSR